MKSTTLFILTFTLSLNLVFAQDRVKDVSPIGESSFLELPQIQVIPIKDTQNERQYELFIKLPESYSENNNIQYPVLYTTDAIWHIELLSASTEYIMEDVILVGISWQKDISQDLINEAGEHVSRYRDYSVAPSSNSEQQAKYQLGQASNHLDFIRNDVFKYVENTYRTDPDNRSYFGYSMGGKFGTYILLTQPDTFRNYILGSPSLMGDIPYFSALESNGELNANVFISYGTLEEELGGYAEELITLLKNRNDESLSLHYEVIEGSHQTAFPMTGVRSVNWLSKINNSPTIESPYFGQKPPGLIPEIFAPGIISINGRYEHSVSFSPDLDEIYFTASKKDEDPSIYFSKLEGKKWTHPKKANFTKGKKVGEMQAFVNPNGTMIHFAAHDAFTLPHHKESVKTWYVKRLGNSWSDAKQLDSPINDDFVFYSNEAKNGDLYYFNVSKRKTYYAPNKNGKFPEVHEVGIGGAHAFISPTQDYIVVNARNKEDDQRKSDIYVYFKKKDGTWSKAINLGKEVNSNFPETCPSITPDGKYLFFGRYNEEGGESNVYWVSTEIISKLKTAYFKK